VIRVEHLMAGLAVWHYCEESARWIFGDRLGDPVADEILRSLRTSSNGLTRTQISDVFGRNVKAGAISHALSQIHSAGLATFALDETGGRPAERWHASQSGHNSFLSFLSSEEHGSVNLLEGARRFVSEQLTAGDGDSESPLTKGNCEKWHEPSRQGDEPDPTGYESNERNEKRENDTEVLLADGNRGMDLADLRCPRRLIGIPEGVEAWETICGVSALVLESPREASAGSNVGDRMAARATLVGFPCIAHDDLYSFAQAFAPWARNQVERSSCEPFNNPGILFSRDVSDRYGSVSKTDGGVPGGVEA
jgi:hypothetical protein